MDTNRTSHSADPDAVGTTGPPPPAVLPASVPPASVPPAVPSAAVPTAAVPAAAGASRWTTVARHDLPASVVVFLVAMPLSLGIALASGATAASGYPT